MGFGILFYSKREIQNPMTILNLRDIFGTYGTKMRKKRIDVDNTSSSNSELSPNLVERKFDHLTWGELKDRS